MTTSPPASGPAAPPLIGVTGATGAIGGAVARALGAAGVAHRLLVRDAGRSPETGGEIALIEGYHDQTGLRQALDQVHTLLLVSARESADRVGEHRTVIEAAVDAGVRRVVYLSFQGAAPDATFTFARDHWATEQILRDSGLAACLLRDSFYQEHLVGLCGPDGVIRGPAGDGAVAAVSQRDVAACAVAALLDPQWDGEPLDVTGPEALHLDEVAAILSRRAGRPVRYEAETVTRAYASRAHYGAPDFEVAGWVSSYESIASGDVATVSDTVARLTGRPAVAFDELLVGQPGLLDALSAGDR